MRMDEAETIASYLGVSVAEVLSHAGVKITDIPAEAKVFLSAAIEPDGTLASLVEPLPLPESVLERATTVLRDLGRGQLVAAQIRASSGWLSLLDDAIVLFEPTHVVDPAAIGALSVCKERGGNEAIVRVIRARRTGEAVVLTPDGKEKGVVLDAAFPILAIIP